jgi:hypothetical protein
MALAAIGTTGTPQSRKFYSLSDALLVHLFTFTLGDSGNPPHQLKLVCKRFAQQCAHSTIQRLISIRFPNEAVEAVGGSAALVKLPIVNTPESLDKGANPDTPAEYEADLVRTLGMTLSAGLPTGRGRESSHFQWETTGVQSLAAMQTIHNRMVESKFRIARGRDPQGSSYLAICLELCEGNEKGSVAFTALRCHRLRPSSDCAELPIAPTSVKTGGVVWWRQGSFTGAASSESAWRHEQSPNSLSSSGCVEKLKEVVALIKNGPEPSNSQSSSSSSSSQPPAKRERVEQKKAAQ